MPRNAKRTQAPAAPQDQAYGQRGDQIAAQQAMPLPQAPSGVPSAPGSVTAPAGQAAGAGGVPAAVPAGNPLDAIMAAARQMAPTEGLLTQPTTRPDEPLTEGLAIGAGAGPEVLHQGDRVAATLSRIAEMTGNPKIQELADRARALGR